MKRILAAAALALALARPVHADDAALRAAAETYAGLPDVQAMMDELMSAETLSANLRASLPPNMNPTPQQIARVGEIMEGAMRPLRPELERAMIEAMIRNFTLDEIEAVTDFYRSPAGAAVMRKMQPFMQDTMAAIAPSMTEFQTAVLPEIIKVLSGE